MSPTLIKIYHSLPPFARDWAASARGLQLRRWRYGPETQQLVEEALEREAWTAKQWADWQKVRLVEILHRAATRVPYYRNLWATRRRGGDTRLWEDLANWPVLSKPSVRANPEAFVADDCDTRRMFCDHTSGTSGTPLNIFLKKPTVHYWYALMEARVRLLNGVSRHSRWAILGGQQIIPPGTNTAPFWVHNWAGNQLYLSANHVSAQNALAFYKKLEGFKPTHLITYSSSAAALAREFTAQGLKCSTIRVAISNAEPLLPSQRACIMDSIAPQVRETYGMGEVVAGASECAHGGLHLWPEAGYLEVFKDDFSAPVADGEAGTFICTGLLNPDMPLIRYAVGDRGVAPEWGRRCRCGRTLPLLKAIEGRNTDVLLTADGRQVFWINPIFYGLPLAEGQLVQEQVRRFTVNLVPAPGFSTAHEDIIKARLIDRVGEADVNFNRMVKIPTGPNGKFKPVISLVATEGNS